MGADRKVSETLFSKHSANIYTILAFLLLAGFSFGQYFYAQRRQQPSACLPDCSYTNLAATDLSSALTALPNNEKLFKPPAY